MSTRSRGAQPGNRSAEKHGAFAADVADIALERLAELEQATPWLRRPEFRSHTIALARVEVQIERVNRFLEERGIVDKRNGRARPAMQLLIDLEGRASKLRDQAGLTPESAVRLQLLKVWTELATQQAELVRGAVGRALEAVDIPALSRREVMLALAQELRHMEAV